MKSLFLGIDIGTSGCKTALFDETGHAAFTASGGYALHYPFPGAVEQDAEDWWGALCLCLKNLWEQGADPKAVSAIGIDGQSWSAIPVDSSGKTLAKTPIWMDTRAGSICRVWEKRLGAEHIFNISANPFSPTYTLPKLLWWMENSPGLVESASHIMQSNSFIAFRLTGRISMDYSMSYGWHNFDQKKLTFDDALTREFGIPTRFLTPPVHSDQVIGVISAEAARATGLSEGTPVVAGGLDAACATLGAGVVSPGQTQEQGGQAGGMSICTDRALAHPKLILGSHVIPNRWLLQGGTVGGGASLKWFSEQLGAAGGDNILKTAGEGVFARLSAEAEGSVPGANGLICLPYFAGERSPLWDEGAKAMYFGLKFSNTHADMVRATMEGAAFALRHNIETAKEAGAEITELRGTGGASNSRIWTQIKADITGIPMGIPDTDDATVRGAAMLAMKSKGLFENYDEAAQKLINITRHQEPQAENASLYGRLYEIYKKLYPATKTCMAELDEISACQN